MATAVKVCHICSTDVSQKKRTKDAQGRYYCEACYKAQSGRGGAVPVAELPKRKAPTPVETAPAPIDEDDGLIELADDVKKAKEPEKPQAMFGCADCKKIAPEKQ